jgi:tRNA-splicing ligase RtcB (3'-phosphate/5'-hydroxy nucleic acid ligase)
MDKSYIFKKGTFSKIINNKEIKIVSNKKLFKNISKDAFLQLENISKIEKVNSPIFAMPDIHVGYDVPIGSVFATDSKKGIISSNAVGYDINCGIRIIKTNLTLKDVKKEDLFLLSKELKKLPLGLSSKGLKISEKDYKDILLTGANWAVSNKYCEKADLNKIYNKGFFKGADISCISKEALKRGKVQVGTLGQGNHFIDILEVSKIFNQKVLENFGLFKGQLVIMLHTGSRGLGHQIATDYFNLFKKKNPLFLKEDVSYFDIDSKDGQNYYKAMLAAANFAFVNRIVLSYNIQEIINKTINVGQEIKFSLLYDLSHNLATIEKHSGKNVLVTRKGATRVFLPEDLSSKSPFKKTGSPIILPGSMLDNSYILVPEKGIKDTFMSVAHGSGRSLSRKKSKEDISYKDLKDLMLNNNIILENISENLAREEQPSAYKSSKEVVSSLENSKMVKKVCSLRPVIVLIG